MTTYKRNPWIAGLLSFFFPSVGHIYVGAAMRGFTLLLIFFLGLILLGRIFGLFSTFWGVISLFMLVIIFELTMIVDAVRLAKSRKEFIPKKYNKWYIYLVSAVIIMVLFSPELIRPILGFNSYYIPARSMMPTLMIGDFVLANTMDKTPARGEVIVFRYPKAPNIQFVKRVIGLPGDKIEYHSSTKVIHINNELVTQQVVGRYIADGSGAAMTGKEERIEYLNGVEYQILVKQGIEKQESLIKEWTVPDNGYFVLGDNRDNSKDSRYWGFVPSENIIGKMTYIWFSWDLQGEGIITERIGNQIK